MLKQCIKTSSTLVVIVILATTVACTPSVQSTTETPNVLPTPTGVWARMLYQTPYPYTTPLPPSTHTILDSTYVQSNPNGGVTKLSLDGGVFRIYDDATGWSSIGSFVLSGERITFFNDPHCYRDSGIYTWEVQDGLQSSKLVLEAIRDDCASELRVLKFADRAWENCQPPGEEAAITQHWPAPDGCYQSVLPAGE